jgi:hypothetical protein
VAGPTGPTGAPGPQGDIGPTGPAGSGGGAATATLGAELVQVAATIEAASATARLVQFDTKRRTDTGFTSTTGTTAGITVPSDGWYELTGRLQFAANLSSGSGPTLGIRRASDSVLLVVSTVYSISGGTPPTTAVAVSGTAYLTAGTTLGLWIDPGGNNNAQAAGRAAGDITFLRVVSLVGQQGPTGPSGGPTGPTGPQGVPGPMAAQAPVIPDLWFPLWPYGINGINSVGNSLGQLKITRTVLTQAVKAVKFDASASSSATIIIMAYADTPTGPGALVAQTPLISNSAAPRTGAFSLAAGVYWIGLMNTNASSMSGRNISGANPYLSGTDGTMGTALANAWIITGVGATPPDPFPMATVARNIEMPAIMLQAV